MRWQSSEGLHLKFFYIPHTYTRAPSVFLCLSFSLQPSSFTHIKEWRNPCMLSHFFIPRRNQSLPLPFQHTQDHALSLLNNSHPTHRHKNANPSHTHCYVAESILRTDCIMHTSTLIIFSFPLSLSEKYAHEDAQNSKKCWHSPRFWSM